MKNKIRIMLLVVVMIFSTSITAQTTIAGGEYWIDGAISARKALSPGTTIDISALTPGLHTLTVRVKDSQGLWSNQMARLFFVMPDGHTDAASVTACEYWIDGAKLPTYTTLSTQVIDISTLTPGLHKLMVRVKDNLGFWSNQITRIFYVMPSGHADATNITAREFWIDGKIVNRQTIDATPAVIDISKLSAGLHTLTMRVQDNLGVWSNQMARQFFVTPTPAAKATLSKYMYWIDDDREHYTLKSVTEESGQIFIDVGNLPKGEHKLTLCFIDSKGAANQLVVQTIKFLIKGDANGDDCVNIADIVSVVNYILGNPSEDFNKDAANVSGDLDEHDEPNINATDVVGIVNVILNSVE